MGKLRKYVVNDIWNSKNYQESKILKDSKKRWCSENSSQKDFGRQSRVRQPPLLERGQRLCLVANGANELFK